MRWILLLGLVQAEPRQATGVKVGEVTDTSAIVWTRVTSKAAREKDGACPGAPGKVRLRCGTREDLGDALSTEWTEVAPARDHTHQFSLTDLKPGTVYHFAAETEGHGTLRGRFQTAPPRDRPADVTFTVITGQATRSLDHPDGFHLYEAMLRLNPHFIVPTGDTVYYDSDPPLATTTHTARFHWHRMYSLPRHVAFHLSVPGYWEKDDHDTLSDDCWPGKGARGDLTFEEGLRIFREQVPMGEKTYRTFRWGRDLQIWLTEGRDFRSPNTMKDGPDKSIWGAEQKAWFKKTVLESDATWKVLVSPTPIVGPDRANNKHDNHANAAFRHEGDEIRRWIRDHVAAQFFVACGDRHWQYYSVHPETGVREFSCGPASDKHSGGSPGENKDYHRFHRVKGGFLAVSVSRPEGKPSIAFRLHDVHGAVVHEHHTSR